MKRILVGLLLDFRKWLSLRKSFVAEFIAYRALKLSRDTFIIIHRPYMKPFDYECCWNVLYESDIKGLPKAMRLTADIVDEIEYRTK